MLAFTLQARKKRPRSQQWWVEAAAQLRSWAVVYDEQLEATPEGTTQLSKDQPRVNGERRIPPHVAVAAPG